MADTEMVEIKGETIIEDSVIASLAAMAAREVEGVVSLGKSAIRRMIAERLGGIDKSAVQVASNQNNVIADLTLTIRYGYNIPQTVSEVRRRVASTLMDNAGLIAKEVHIHVSSIEFPEEEKSFAFKGHQH